MATSSAEPKLYIFPVEVWLKIIELCSYFELKSLQAASPAFEKILAHADYDHELFRPPPMSRRESIHDMSTRNVSSAMVDVQLEVNPALHHILYELRRKGAQQPPRLLSHVERVTGSVYADLAIWPPTRNIHIHLGRDVIHFAPGAKTGLTLGEVMRALMISDTRFRRRRSRIREEAEVKANIIQFVVDWELVRCSSGRRIVLKAIWSGEEHDPAKRFGFSQWTWDED